jgi:hypothetical protein
LASTRFAGSIYRKVSPLTFASLTLLSICLSIENIMDNKRVTYNDGKIWAKVFLFFGYNVTMIGPEYCVVVNGFGRLVLPVQAQGT